MLRAMGSRWQPDSASEILSGLAGMPLDPSSPERPTTSKIVIDATRQLPDEGGPATYPELNRTLFERGAPNAIQQIDAKWGGQLKSYRPG